MLLITSKGDRPVDPAKVRGRSFGDVHSLGFGVEMQPVEEGKLCDHCIILASAKLNSSVFL